MRSGRAYWPLGAVVDDRVRRPAVPQRLDHGHELLAAGIAVGVADLARAAVIARRRREPRGHDVPGGAAVADMVDRGELARQVERLGIGGRGGRDQPDMAGRHAERRQHGDRFEPGARRLPDILGKRQLVGEKDRVEQRRLGPLRQILVIADVGQRQRRGVRMPPRRLVVAAAVHKQVQMQLPFHRDLFTSTRCNVRVGSAGMIIAVADKPSTSIISSGQSPLSRTRRGSRPQDQIKSALRCPEDVGSAVLWPGYEVQTPSYRAISTGMFVSMMMCRVAPPKIIWRMRLCV